MSADRWRGLVEAHKCVASWCRQRQWRRVATHLGVTLDEAKEIGRWLRSSDAAEPEQSPATPEAEPDDGVIEDLNESYWLDRDRGRYVFHLPTRGPFALPVETIDGLREAYSNLGGGATINQCARRFGLSRPTAKAVIRALGLTHDSPPWSPEFVATTNEDVLVDDLIQRKTERVMVKAERKSWARVKRDAEAFRRLDLLAQRLAAHFETLNRTHEIPRLRLPRAREPFRLVMSPTDFHWGKRGVDGYCREVARRRLFETTDRLLDRVVNRGQPDRILLMMGSDGLHIDNAQNATTRGTPQDVDGTPEELAATWVDLCAQYVEHVAQVAPVTVYVIPGNHDTYTSALVRAALVGWFRHSPDIEVSRDLRSRQWHVYGRSLLVFLHGDIGKARDWMQIIAEEARGDWGKTDRTFVFTGHLHTERELPQFGGSIVYRMPSLAGTDRWHHRSGYVSGRKAIAAYVIDEARGVIATEVEEADDSAHGE